MKRNTRPFLFVLFIVLGFLLPTGRAERIIRLAEKNGIAEAKRSGKSLSRKPAPARTMAAGNRVLSRSESPGGSDGISPELTTPVGCTSSTATFTQSSQVTIPASGTPVVTSGLGVAGVGSYLYDLNVTTSITHTSNQDLDITLTSPGGHIVTLTTDNGSSNDDVFNGTVWDDQVDPGTQVPYASNNNLVVDHVYTNLTLASPLVPEEPLGAFIGENPNGTWTLTISDDSNGEGGFLNSWSLEITSLPIPPPLTTMVTFVNVFPMTISSGGTPLVTSTIDVSGLGPSISDVNLTALITHTFNGDLDITITSPNGTVVTLVTDRGGNFDNIFNGTVWDDDASPGSPVPYAVNPNITSDHVYADGVLATTLTPLEPLAAFTGENPNGTWTLTISDDASGDGGALNLWALDIRTAQCPQADLSVAISDSPDPVNAGNNLIYSLAVTNAGPTNADALFGALVPFNTTFVSLAQTSGPAFVLTTPPVGGTGAIAANNLNLAAGASATFTCVVKVNLSTLNNTVITNTATVNSLTSDPNSANNMATTSTTVVVPPPPPLTFFAAVDSNNNLMRFNSDAPGVITSSKPITGLLGGEQIIGLDRRPANGQIFAMGQVAGNGRLLTIDLQTGVATQVGSGFALPLSALVIQGTNYGFDFNPQVDRVRVVADSRDNFRLNPNTGGIAGADTALTSGSVVTAAAYDRSFAGTTQTTLFGIDVATDQLVRIGDVNGTPLSPNTGQVFPIGSLGVDTTGLAGFDIVSEQMTDRAWAALTTGGVAGLYTVDLATAQVAFVGIIGSGLPNIRGLTVVPTPKLSISDVTVTEGDSGSVNATFDVSLSARSDQTVIVDYFTANGTATQPADYTSVNGPLFFSPGQTLRTVTVPVNGDTLQEGDETFFVNLTNVTNSFITDAQGVGTIHDNEPAIATLSFSAVSYGGIEDCGVILVTVNRAGNTASTMSVRYATADGSASSRTDYTSGSGTLTFGPGDTSKTVPILISEDSYVEGTETASITLSNATGGAVLGSPATASIVIIDDAVEAAGNPINDSTIFVCQHYHDLLNREPDPSGLAFWVNNIESCGADAGCREAKRIDTSASFFLSIEFQETGGTIERIFRAAFNRRALIAEFLPDSQRLGSGVIFLQPGYQTVLEANKVAFYDQFIARPEFVSVFGGLSNAQFVDALNGNTGGALSGSERDALVAALDSATKTRAQALRSIVEDADFINGEFTRAFVTMQYFGYLRRDPDEAGFIFWLNKLNSFGGDFRRAEMVRAFISSIEYGQRFAP